MQTKSGSSRTKKNERIMSAVARIKQIKTQAGVAYTRLLPATGIGYGRFMRYKRRIAAGRQPLKSPGPKKIEPFDLGELTRKIGNLNHGKKRTQGTGDLYRLYKDAISRREFNQMVAAVRRNYHHDCGRPADLAGDRQGI